MPLSAEQAAEVIGRLDIPSRKEARTMVVPLEAGARGAEKTQFSAELPADLASAIALEGEMEVMKRVVQSIVIEKQGEKRRELQAKEEGSQGRAKYMQQLGF